jgi:ABC-2 type transport system ATP-binding protein
VTSTLVLRSLVRTLAAAGKVILYSSHVLESVEQVASDVLILHDSRVVAHDSVSRLRDMLELASLEQVFRKVVVASDVDQAARDVIGVMKL